MTLSAFQRHYRTPRERNTGPRRPVRAALLGAAALLALGTAVTGVTPFDLARAEAPPAQSLAPVSGPASFADVVERVKGAVVAIKVKAVEDPDGRHLRRQTSRPTTRCIAFSSASAKVKAKAGPVRAKTHDHVARLWLHHQRRRLCRHQ